MGALARGMDMVSGCAGSVEAGHYISSYVQRIIIKANAVSFDMTKLVRYIILIVSMYEHLCVFVCNYDWRTLGYAAGATTIRLIFQLMLARKLEKVVLNTEDTIRKTIDVKVEKKTKH